MYFRNVYIQITQLALESVCRLITHSVQKFWLERAGRCAAVLQYWKAFPPFLVLWMKYAITWVWVSAVPVLSGLRPRQINT